MGRFLIFIGVVLVLSVIGLGVWWLGNLIYIRIRRAEKKFEIEEEGYELAKECIRDRDELDEEDYYDELDEDYDKWFE